MKYRMLKGKQLIIKGKLVICEVGEIINGDDMDAEDLLVLVNMKGVAPVVDEPKATKEVKHAPVRK